MSIFVQCSADNITKSTLYVLNSLATMWRSNWRSRISYRPLIVCQSPCNWRATEESEPIVAHQFAEPLNIQWISFASHGEQEIDVHYDCHPSPHARWQRPDNTMWYWIVDVAMVVEFSRIAHFAKPILSVSVQEGIECWRAEISAREIWQFATLRSWHRRGSQFRPIVEYESKLFCYLENFPRRNGRWQHLPSNKLIRVCLHQFDNCVRV